MPAPAPLHRSPRASARGPRLLRGVVAAAAIAVLPLTGCGPSEGEQADALVGDAVVPTPTASVDGPSEVGGGAGGGGADTGLGGRAGEQLELTGEVVELLPPNAFTVGGEQVGSTSVLVVGSDVPADLAVGDAVTVNGTVEVFQVGDYEEALGIDLADEEFEPYQGVAAVQAESVTAG